MKMNTTPEINAVMIGVIHERDGADLGGRQGCHPEVQAEGPPRDQEVGHTADEFARVNACAETDRQVYQDDPDVESGECHAVRTGRLSRYCSRRANVVAQTGLGFS
jgi:hypothetical protein